MDSKFGNAFADRFRIAFITDFQTCNCCSDFDGRSPVYTIEEVCKRFPSRLILIISNFNLIRFFHIINIYVIIVKISKKMAIRCPAR